MNGATAEPGTVGELPKRCGQRLSSNTRSLGVCVRAPVRIGKTVTQEQVAEAAGISRVWYATLENDRATRVSVRVLEELASVLHMELSERAALFRLALPELRSASLSERSAGLLDAFASIRLSRCAARPGAPECKQ
ncbi:MAG: helix-turn-helix transcriptional regulator [Candidatus Cybelea sp.]